MMTPSLSKPHETHVSLAGMVRKALTLADAIPLSVIQLGARVAVANVFWNSAQS